MRLTAHVKSSKVKFEAVQRHRRKHKEVRTEQSRFESTVRNSTATLKER